MACSKALNAMEERRQGSGKGSARDRAGIIMSSQPWSIVQARASEGLDQSGSAGDLLGI